MCCTPTCPDATVSVAGGYRGVGVDGCTSLFTVPAEKKDLGTFHGTFDIFIFGVVEELDVVPEDIGLGFGEGVTKTFEGEEVFWRESKEFGGVLRGKLTVDTLDYT